MPHPNKAEAIEAECEAARQRAREQTIEDLTRSIAHWARAEKSVAHASSEAFAAERGRHARLMLAAIEADGAEGS
jgi:hypothetical protein